jgi:hypothetical protein
VIQGRLRETVPRDVEELLPHLERRGRELAEGARLLLDERAAREAQEMRRTWRCKGTGSRRPPTATYRDPQMVLNFDAEEDRQLQANRRHWDKRLAAIEQELTTDPERIRALYDVKTERLVPVGLVYLWPVTG